VILVDTSVWVEHFRGRSASLGRLLAEDRAWCHPFVIGEIALGHLRNRAEVLSLLAELPRAPEASHEEVLRLVELHRLMGAVIGWIDAHLLASAAIGGLALWTADTRLGRAAERVGLAWNG